ncbi:MAG: hypothetical protein H0V17_31405, partial [Deltaproteobacteria bacterium]|nr:hypothetical protein [Deltaproteobacteria bacterium]
FDGELVIGDLSITGRLGHVPVAITLVFDQVASPQVLGVRASVGDSEIASAAARETKLQIARPLETGVEAHQALSERVRTWPPDFLDLVISDGVVSASWLSRERLDATRVRELVHALGAVLAVLDPGAGPYR